MYDLTGMDFSEILKTVKLHKQTAITISEIAHSFLVLGSGLVVPFIRETEPVNLPEGQLCYVVTLHSVEDVRILGKMASELLVIGEPLYVSQSTE